MHAHISASTQDSRQPVQIRPNGLDMQPATATIPHALAKEDVQHIPKSSDAAHSLPSQTAAVSVLQSAPTAAPSEPSQASPQTPAFATSSTDTAMPGSIAATGSATAPDVSTPAFNSDQSQSKYRGAFDSPLPSSATMADLAQANDAEGAGRERPAVLNGLQTEVATSDAAQASVPPPPKRLRAIRNFANLSSSSPKGSPQTGRGKVGRPSQRPVAEEIAPPAHTITSENIGPYPPIEGKYLEVQNGRCIKKDYTHAKKCTTCVTRQARSECLFSGFRTFVLDLPPYNAISSATPYFFPSSFAADYPLDLSARFNREISDADKQEMKETAAAALLPAIRTELQHAQQERAVRRPFDYSSRNTCDFCLTTFFMGSWYCGDCGRDYCFDCHEMIRQYLPGDGQPLHCTTPSAALNGGEENPGTAPTEEPAAQQSPAPSERAASVDKEDFLASLADEPTFSETGRIVRKLSTPRASVPPKNTGRQLNISAHAASDYDRLPESVTLLKGKIQNPQIRRLLGCVAGRLHSLDFLIPVTSKTVEELSHLADDMQACSSAAGAPMEIARNPYILPAHLADKASASVPDNSLPYLIVDQADLTDDIFHKIWREGQTLVVENCNAHLEIDWSPRAFALAFPKMDCEVEDCLTGITRRYKVPEFFGTFGKPKRNQEIWKLKVSWLPGRTASYVADSLPLCHRRTGHRRRTLPLGNPISSMTTTVLSRCQT